MKTVIRYISFVIILVSLQFHAVANDVVTVENPEDYGLMIAGVNLCTEKMGCLHFSEDLNDPGGVLEITDDNKVLVYYLVKGEEKRSPFYIGDVDENNNLRLRENSRARSRKAKRLECGFDHALFGKYIPSPYCRFVTEYRLSIDFYPFHLYLKMEGHSLDYSDTVVEVDTVELRVKEAIRP